MRNAVHLGNLCPALVVLSFGLLIVFSGQSETLYSEANLAPYVLTVGILAALVHFFSSFRLFTPGLLLFFSLLIGVLFLRYSEGQVIFSDDHPSFLYRFQLLRDHFPQIPFYNPAWNAGYSAREFFPSGILNCFFMASPLIYLAGDLSTWGGLVIYNYILVWLFLIIVPAFIFLAGKIIGLSTRASVIASFIAFAPSLSYYEWLLTYGTLGFVFSAGALPLTVALIYRLIFDPRKSNLGHVLALLLGSFFCISWSLSGFVFIPLIILALLKLFLAKDIERLKLVAIFCFLFVACNGLWVKVFVQESKVFSFISGNEMPGAEKASQLGSSFRDNKSRNVEKTAQAIKGYIYKVNPLIPLLFLPGVFLLKGFWLRACFVSLLLWILGMAYLGTLYKPQLELSRLILPLSFLLCLPTALVFEKSLEFCSDNFTAELGKQSFGKNGLCFFVSSIVLGFVFLNPLLAGAAWSNRSEQHFVLEPTEFQTLSEAMALDGGNQRIFFLGFVLHELGSSQGVSQDGGHLAPLARMSGKALYSSDFYHTRWSSVDPVPASFRERGAEGIEEFLDLVSVSAVVTAKKEWIEYCEKDSRYQKVFSGSRFTMFTRASLKNSWFLQGRGRLENLKDGISLVPESEKIVLKFRYQEKLKTNFPKLIELKPAYGFVEDVGKSKKNQVNFIELELDPKLIENKSLIKISY